MVSHFRRGKNFNAFFSRLLTQHHLERRQRLLARPTGANWARTVAAEAKVRARSAGQGRRGTRRAPRPGPVLAVVEFVVVVDDDAAAVRATATPAAPATMLAAPSKRAVVSLCDYVQRFSSLLFSLRCLSGVAEERPRLKRRNQRRENGKSSRTKKTKKKK